MTRTSGASGRDGEPLVSVILPAFNAEDTVRKTLRSVAAQTYRNVEIVVVDDGSTDRTAAVAREFCSTDPRARLIEKPNGGVASARNLGIEKASGEWIAPIDADDLWHPTKIEKQVRTALSAAARPGFVYCWRRVIDDDDRVIVSGSRWTVEGRAFSQLAYINVVECASTPLFWREAVLEAGGYDETLRREQAQGCEDMMLQLQVAHGYPIAVVREYLVGWRLHEQNMSSDFDQMARSCSRAFERLIADGLPVPTRAVRWAEARNAFDIAQQRAAARDLAATLRWLTESLRLDPAGSSLLLAYRAARSTLRRLRSPGAAAQAPRFQDVDPCAAMGGDPHELKGFMRLLDALHSRRLARLAAAEVPPGAGRRAAQPVKAA